MTSISIQPKPSLDRKLQAAVTQAARRLQAKLARLDLDSLDISQYNKNYLRRKLANPIGSLQLYAHLLTLSLSNQEQSVSDVAFVDYGGGTGLLSLLAKELGVGCVIYNDIYSVSCQDIQKLAWSLGIGIDHYVCGDIDELVAYTRQRDVCVSAIASYDVIEHIYDIESYFKRLRALSPAPLCVVFGSSANNANPFIRRRFQKIQIRREYRNRTKKPGHNEREGQRAFFEVRQDIIRDFAPGMKEQLVTQLATATRGLRQEDIEAVVAEFLRTGRLSCAPTHPTNTCDPYTGNWAEHLMPAEWLANMLRRLGFRVQILNGPWRYDRRLWKRCVKGALNRVIGLLGTRALCCSPYYIVYAVCPAHPKPDSGNSRTPSDRDGGNGEP